MMEKELPEGWAVLPLGELFQIERGGSPRPIENFITNDQNGINWIKIGDTKGLTKYIYSTKEKIKPEGLYKSRMVYVGDFILSNSMSFGRPYIMKTEGCIHDGWLVIRITDEIIDSDYLYYVLSSSYVYNQFSALAKGSTVRNLNIQSVKRVNIFYPPLAEQKRIVAKLDMAFGHLDNIKKAWERTLQLRTRFVDSCLIKTGQLSYHKAEKLSSYLQESTKRIGKDWLGKSKVGVSAQKGIINLDTGQKVSFENYKIVQPGDFVYNAMRINIGSIAQYEGDEIAITSPDYIVFRIKNHLSPKLLLGFLKSSNGLMEIGSNTKGSVRSRLYFKSLANVNYPIAPLSVQEQAEKVLTWYSGATGKWENIIEISLNKIQQAMLAQAFRGELVPQDPDDEPASVLLEKIQKEMVKLGKKGKKQMELAFAKN